MSTLNIRKNQSIQKFDNFHYVKKNAPSFEGFYFKAFQPGGSILVIICGFSKSRKKSNAFLQVCTPFSQTKYFEYELNKLKIGKGTFQFTIGSSFFSNEEISIQEKECNIHIQFTSFNQWPRSKRKPGIMELLSYIPGVECKHDVVAPHIQLNGAAQINHKKLFFTNGTGYIDKNWGQSFPTQYSWGHLTGFKDSSISIQFARGYPRWMFWNIPVYIGFLKIGDRIYTFQSWKRGKMTMINVGQTVIELTSQKWKIFIRLEEGSALKLLAPRQGKLNDNIVEHAGGKATVRVFKKSHNKTCKLFLDEVVTGTTFESR